MAIINPYVTFNGNCEDAFTFYKSVFGGEFTFMGRFKEMPPTEGMTVPESEGEKIMHVSLPISKETILMGSDTSAAFGQTANPGTNFSISITADTKAEADKLFNAISAGGKITMPLADTFWESYFGMCTDKFGIGWMMSYDAQKK